ncbi:MAG TPA: acyl-CoA dehydrogenase [Acidimicrobiales bacterium]|nr:acyl-CoA dehydrogenase [Acidimicrobiales bacterium]
MPIAITDDHVALSSTAAEVLAKREARAAARARLEEPTERLPELWEELAALGWLGLHLPEAHGGSGYGLEEVVVVAEELGRALAPVPFTPTVIVSALVDAAGDDALKQRLLPGLADGTARGGLSFGGTATLDGERLSGTASPVLGAGLATVFAVRVGDDVAIVDAGDGVSVTEVPNLDPTRRSARVTFDAATATVLRGAAGRLLSLTRLLLSAEAVGVARACTEEAADYAKNRLQFGRPIAMYQGVKHHCANMAVATELATAAVWDAARAAAHDPGQAAYTAAVAATLAGPAADFCANHSTQVHGGIGFTWAHDAHMFMRRATALLALLEPEKAAADLTAMLRAGVTRAAAIDLPPEAEPIRDEVRAFAASIAGLDPAAQRTKLIESGYVMPHWPKPWGRAAGALEQLVIEEEFAKAGVKRPAYGITGWILLTLIQHATADQVQRWVPPALNQELIWCQLFSEPDAGSDAAGIKTKATRVDGGWLVNGQKVWTSGAHLAGRGFATVRTNPDVPKHQGITIMVIDMHAEGVEVRPLRQATGNADFNEVFFTDVFVPDDDVVGPVDGGWTVARATLGNESVSIGGGQGGMAMPATALVAAIDASPGALAAGDARVGTYAATQQAMAVLNLRAASRALAGAEPGPEGAMTKLVLSEMGHEAAAILAAAAGGDGVFMDGAGATAGFMVLSHRGLSIAGGTSEIKRNQIGERILGLPRDPLLK